jgi:hypothetical protein
MLRANRHFLPGRVWHIYAAASSNRSSRSWFDRLTMTGPIFRSS